jgi:hypothetical protein
MNGLKPRRVAARPSPCDWADDELMSLQEAAALLWPAGPLTASSLRTAYRRGELEVVVIARKILVTKKGLAGMVDLARRRVDTRFGKSGTLRAVGGN